MESPTLERELVIAPAAEHDVPVILTLIRELAEYERLSQSVVATEQGLRDAVFGPDAFVEVLIARVDGEPAGFALFFHNFSTFVGRRGIYLEDLYVRPHARGHGIGKALLGRLAQITVERDCGRLEWSVLDWNEPAIGFYRALGAEAMDDWTVFRLSGEELRKLARDDGRRHGRSPLS